MTMLRTRPSNLLATNPAITTSEATASLFIPDFTLANARPDGAQLLHSGHDRFMCTPLERVVKRVELGQCWFASFEGLKDEVVGKPWIFGQERSMQVTTVKLAIHCPFCAVNPIVSIALHDSRQRLASLAQECLSTMVLKSNEGSPGLADQCLYDDIADRSARAGHRPGIKDAEPWDLFSLECAKVLPKKLIAATNG